METLTGRMGTDPAYLKVACQAAVTGSMAGKTARR
jgi:hypothetical protein